MNRYSAPLAVILLSSALNAGGPVYSRYGYGDLLYYNGSRSFALGGGGFGLLGDNFIGRMNPASLAQITKTRFSAGFDFNRYATESSTGSSTFARAAFQGMAFATPIDKDYGIVFSFDATPYSAVSYALQREDTTGSVQSTQKYFGAGGLSTLSLSASVSASQKVHLGMKFQYYFGRTNQLTKIDFSQGDRADYNIDKSVFYGGMGLTVGAVLEDVGTLFQVPSLDRVNVGFVLTTPVKLHANEETSFSIVSDTIFSRSGTSDLPFGVGAGLAYRATERTTIVADIYAQQWSGIAFYSSLPNFQPQNSVRLSGGAEFLPSRDAVGYWQRIVYRVGASYHNTYYNINGQGIGEALLTAGLGMPLSGDARLNIGLQAGVRGTTAKGLQRDTIVRLSLAIAGSELWFLKFEEE